jgi:hypothetical protein
VQAAKSEAAAWDSFFRIKDSHTYGLAATAAQAKQQLNWQKDIIPTSLLVPTASSDTASSSSYVASAVKLHKKIIVLTGDRSSKQTLLSNFRALELLVRPEPGSNAPDLREEFFFQLIKQLTRNPKLESEVMVWRLLCFACSSVLLDRSAGAPAHVAAVTQRLQGSRPTNRPQLALLHVLNFLLAEHARASAGAAASEPHGVVTLPYAQFCLRALATLQVRGAIARARCV